MSYRSGKSLNVELSDNLEREHDFQFSPALAVLITVWLVFLLTVYK